MVPAEPGSCLGSQQSYKEPIEIQLVHEVPRIRHIVTFLDWDGDGDLDFVATYWDDKDYKKRRCASDSLSDRMTLSKCTTWWRSTWRPWILLTM